MMTKYSSVVFDLDDTLVDTRSSLELARRAAIKHISTRITIDVEFTLFVWEHLGLFFGAGKRKSLLMATLTELNVKLPELEQLVDDALGIYINQFYSSLSPMPYALELLDFLKMNNLTLGILTNGDRSHQFNKMEYTGIKTFFNEENIAVYPLGNICAKPSPQGLLELCRKLNLIPSLTLYVGDKLTDVIAANLAGACSVRLVTNSAKSFEPVADAVLKSELPNHIIYSLSEIRGIIEG